MPSRVSPWRATLRERLDCFAIPEPNSGCLLWTGSTTSRGYGKVSWQGKQHHAHRMAWTDAYGPPPDDMFLCHKCDVRACINVNHLFLGSHADNMRDMAAKGRFKLPPAEALKRGQDVRRQRGRERKPQRDIDDESRALQLLAAAPRTTARLAKELGLEDRRATRRLMRAIRDQIEVDQEIVGATGYLNFVWRPRAEVPAKP